jgi:HlyD family secretion protein
MTSPTRDTSLRFANDELVVRPPSIPRLALIIGAVGALIVSGLVIRRLALTSIPVQETAVALVQRGTFEHRITATGRLEALQGAQVVAGVSGRVERVVAARGTSVAAGETILVQSNADVVIAALESERLALRAADDARADVERAQVTAAEARRRAAEAAADASDAARAVIEGDTLLRVHLISVHDAERRREKHAAAVLRAHAESLSVAMADRDAERRRARAARESTVLESLRGQYGRQAAELTVRAPVSGRVEDFEVQPGQWLTSGQSIARIVTAGALVARIQVFDADAREIGSGQPVLLRVDRDSLWGTVSRVAGAARNGQVDVEVQLPRGAGSTFRPDQSVTGEIIVRRMERATMVRRPPWITSPGVHRVLCLKGTDVAETCELRVVAVSRDLMAVSPPYLGWRLLVDGDGPPDAGTHVRVSLSKEP